MPHSKGINLTFALPLSSAKQHVITRLNTKHTEKMIIFQMLVKYEPKFLRMLEKSKWHVYFQKQKIELYLENK